MSTSQEATATPAATEITLANGLAGRLAGLAQWFAEHPEVAGLVDQVSVAAPGQLGSDVAVHIDGDDAEFAAVLGALNADADDVHAHTMAPAGTGADSWRQGDAMVSRADGQHWVFTVSTLALVRKAKAPK